MRGENKLLQSDLSHKLKRIMRKYHDKLNKVDIKKYLNNTEQYKICSGGFICATPNTSIRSKSIAIKTSYSPIRSKAKEKNCK